MSTQKQQYLEKIRSTTAYPFYRTIVGIIAILGYLLAAVNVLMTLVSGFRAMGDSVLFGFGILLLGLIVSALIAVGSRFSQEAALILADIADSVAEANSRDVEQPQP